MGRFEKFINKILDKLSAKQISWIVILLAYLIVVNVISNVIVSSHKYDLSEFSYSVDNQGLGIIVDGPKSYFSYGPYTNLASGNWKYTIEYESENDQEFDIVAKRKDSTSVKLASGDLPNDKFKVSKVFNNENSITNNSVEYRTSYSGEGRFQLKAVKVSRAFVFKWYFIITIITAIVSLILFVGKDFFKMTETPKKVLYFTIFYLAVFLISIWTMVYLPDQQGEAIYIAMDILIVLHAWGLRKEIYKYFTRRNVLVFLGYLYMIISLYVIDLILRYISNESTDMTFSSYEPNLFSFAVIGVITLIISFLPKRWMKRTFYGIVYFASLILLAVQTVYYQVFDKLFSFKDIKLAKEGSDYADYVLGLINGDFITVAIILVLVGIIGIFAIQKSFKIQKEWYLIIISVVASIIIYSQSLYSGDYGSWDSFKNPSYIYATFSDRVGAFQLCGFYQYELRDLHLALFGNGSNTGEQKELVDEYYEAKEAPAENEFTGVFEGKNVIFFLMESIDDIAVREDVMPTLYKMSKQGISFNNMYASIYGSAATLNAEMVTNIGLYAPTDGSLVYSFSDNYFPYSIANRFTEQGYACRQYHFNDPEFYSRNLMNKAFGYKEYVCYKEYEPNNFALDFCLADNFELFNTLVQDEKFFDYVITYTAHLSYASDDGTVQSAMENYPEYSELTSSEEINNYFAKARYTDDMFTKLISRLREEGKLENTVIVAVGDHYPYGIEDEDTLYSLAGVDRYTQLLYTTPFIIWTPGMSEMGLSNIQIDKVCSNVDIVPTLVNLFNVGDKSVYLGHDIFDEDYEGIAYFEDGSWITNDTYYFNGNKVWGNINKEEIAEINEEILNTINVNDSILHSDYYR